MDACCASLMQDDTPVHTPAAGNYFFVQPQVKSTKWIREHMLKSTCKVASISACIPCVGSIPPLRPLLLIMTDILWKVVVQSMLSLSPNLTDRTKCWPGQMTTEPLSSVWQSHLVDGSASTFSLRAQRRPIYVGDQKTRTPCFTR